MQDTCIFTRNLSRDVIVSWVHVDFRKFKDTNILALLLALAPSRSRKYIFILKLRQTHNPSQPKMYGLREPNLRALFRFCVSLSWVHRVWWNSVNEKLNVFQAHVRQKKTFENLFYESPFWKVSSSTEKTRVRKAPSPTRSVHASWIALNTFSS